MKKLTIVVALILISGLIISSGCLNGTEENATGQEEEDTGFETEEGTTGEYKYIDSCGKIDEAGKYKITNDLSSKDTCLELNSDNIKIDGENHLIEGTEDPRTYGIYAEAKENLSIRNLKVRKYEIGINLRNAFEATVEGTETNENSRAGVLLEYSIRGTVENVESQENSRGVYLIGTSGTKIKNNQIRDNKWGIHLKESSKNKITDNEIRNNGRGIELYNRCSDNQIENNIVCGNSINDIELDNVQGSDNKGSNTCEETDIKGNNSIICTSSC